MVDLKQKYNRLLVKYKESLEIISKQQQQLQADKEVYDMFEIVSSQLLGSPETDNRDMKSETDS